MRIVLLGPPGSGKGTQGRFLAKTFHLTVLGMGDLLRAEVAQKTTIGEQIGPILERGEFPPSTLVSDILFKSLGSHETFIIDGYPRDLEQAEVLDQFLVQRGRPLTHAIFFHVNEDFLLERLLNRYTCASCGAPYAKGVKEPRVAHVCDFCAGTTFTYRPDDQEAVARARIERAQERDKIVLEYYEKKGILHKVDGSLSVPQVAEVLTHLLGDRFNETA